LEFKLFWFIVTENSFGWDERYNEFRDDFDLQ